MSALVTEPVQIFAIVLVIILLAPVIFNRLKIPHLIGLILAGVVIGPHGFNILDRDSSFAIFGQVGLLYLMFLAGLEIDMFHLRLNLRRGLWFGLMTLLFPLLAGVASSVWLLHLDWLTSLLLGSMYASHTLLSYPVVTRYGIAKTKPVLIAVVGTIIAVIGALLVLAVVVNVDRYGLSSYLEILRLIVFLLVFCIAVVWLYPRITRWFFNKYSDKVTQYVYVLAMVFLAAWAAQAIGLEPVLGAFLAGLVLNRYVPASSPLMGSIEFVGNALFIPYFLISVGMMINLRVVFNGATLAVAGVMLAVAVASKWLPAFVAQKAAGMSRADRGVMFGLTAAHTAVALAVVTLGHNMGLLDQRILNATILVILITCGLAPIVTNIYAPAVKLALLRSGDEADDVSHRDTARTRVNNTLIPCANIRSAEELAELAVLMRNLAGRSSLYALHVRNDNSPAARSLSRDTLQAASRVAQAAEVPVTCLERFDLNVTTGILNAIEERDITEIILGLHRRQTFIDSFFGAKVEQLLKATNRMVLITRLFGSLSTVARIVVYVPHKAEYESGFSRWVRCIARLAQQLGCRVIFCCSDQVQLLIRGVIYQENYGIRCEFRPCDSWDDFITLSPRVRPDDLLFVISARPASVSYAAEMADVPLFLQRYFGSNSIVVIYPEQFGESDTLPVYFADPMASDIASGASPLWRRLKGVLRRRLGSGADK